MKQERVPASLVSFNMRTTNDQTCLIICKNTLSPERCQAETDEGGCTRIMVWHMVTKVAGINQYFGKPCSADARPFDGLPSARRWGEKKRKKKKLDHNCWAATEMYGLRVKRFTARLKCLALGDRLLDSGRQIAWLRYTRVLDEGPSYCRTVDRVRRGLGYGRDTPRLWLGSKQRLSMQCIHALQCTSNETLITVELVQTNARPWREKKLLGYRAAWVRSDEWLAAALRMVGVKA